MAKASSLDADPNDETPVEPATPIDALRGVYSYPAFPALSAKDQSKSYEIPTKNAWAYWPGTSFATPIISGIAARVLEQIKLSNKYEPSHLRAAQVQWTITTAKGQETMLTRNGALPLQRVLGVSMLKAVQTCKEYKRK